MLNGVVIEGCFTGRAWHYAGDLFFRLSNCRDWQRPAKPQVEGREQPDYVSVTIGISASGVPLALQKGALYRVHGYRQSREYKETPGEYIKSVHGLTNMFSVSAELRREITPNRAEGVDGLRIEATTHWIDRAARFILRFVKSWNAFAPGH